MEGGETLTGKRPREDEEETEKFPPSSSPEAKRLHAELLLDILDDVDDRDSVDDAGDGNHLADVMRSLEEEIGFPSPHYAAAAAANDDDSGDNLCTTDLIPGGHPCSTGSDDGSRQPELGFLFEASDDELGLPPTTATAVVSTSEDGDLADEEVEIVQSQNWEFVDQMASSYDAFDLGFDGDVAKTVACGVPEQGHVSFQMEVFDGGYPDVLFSSSNQSDLSPEISWLPEFLPAV